ncbi:MAG TPA: hypothetical protein DEG43_02220 [Acidimicrobiaceae bacterium]|jgi:hypothetical protein|nr:hypothetical protein [Acidimicrobiaceae bacterium]
MAATRAQRLLVAVTALAAISGVACAPAPTPTPTPPPPATAVVSPTAATAGTFINVTPPNNACKGGAAYSSLEAQLVTLSGIVISRAYAYVGNNFSGYANPDMLVKLRVPPATALGTYQVFLSCYGYLDQYLYAPAKFTVTA